MPTAMKYEQVMHFLWLTVTVDNIYSQLHIQYHNSVHFLHLNLQREYCMYSNIKSKQCLNLYK